MLCEWRRLARETCETLTVKDVSEALHRRRILSPILPRTRFLNQLRRGGLFSRHTNPQTLSRLLQLLLQVPVLLLQALMQMLFRGGDFGGGRGKRCWGWGAVAVEGDR